MTNEWSVLEKMIEDWLDAGHASDFNSRQALIPIREFIFKRAYPGGVEEYLLCHKE